MRFSLRSVTAQNELNLAFFHVGFNLLSLFITPRCTSIPLAVPHLLDPWWFPDLQPPDQAGFKVRQDK